MRRSKATYKASCPASALELELELASAKSYKLDATAVVMVLALATKEVLILWILLMASNVLLCSTPAFCR